MSNEQLREWLVSYGTLRGLIYAAKVAKGADKDLADLASRVKEMTDEIRRFLNDRGVSWDDEDLEEMPL